MAPKCKSSDAGSASKPKRSRDVLSISEKLKILDMIEIEKKSYAEIARLCGKNKYSIREVMKSKEKIRASFSVTPHTAKVTAIARDNVSMKVDMIDEQVEEHIEEHQELLMNEELEDLVKSSTEVEEETEVESAVWTLEKFGEVFRMAQNLNERIMDHDLMMKHSMKGTCTITEALQPFQEMFNELKRQKQQLPITMFFHKVEKKVSTIEDPQP